MLRTRWILVFIALVLIGSNVISSNAEAQVVGPSQPTQTVEAEDPFARYTEVAEGRRDGHIVLSHPRESEDLVIFCAGGELQSGVVWRPAVADVVIDEEIPIGVSCTRGSLQTVFPGAEWVIHIDPLAGWTFQTGLGESPEILAECHDGFLINIRTSPDGTWERMIDPDPHKCNGTPAGVL